MKCNKNLIIIVIIFIITFYILVTDYLQNYTSDTFNIEHFAKNNKFCQLDHDPYLIDLSVNCVNNSECYSEVDNAKKTILSTRELHQKNAGSIAKTNEWKCKHIDFQNSHSNDNKKNLFKICNQDTNVRPYFCDKHFKKSPDSNIGMCGSRNEIIIPNHRMCGKIGCQKITCKDNSIPEKYNTCYSLQDFQKITQLNYVSYPDLEKIFFMSYMKLIITLKKSGICKLTTISPYFSNNNTGFNPGLFQKKGGIYLPFMQGNFVDYLLLKMYDSKLCLSSNCSSSEVVLKLFNFLTSGYTIPSKLLLKNIFKTRGVDQLQEELVSNNTITVDLQKTALIYCNNIDTCSTPKSSREIIDLIKSIINVDTLYHFGGIGENSIESGKDNSGSKEGYNYINSSEKEVYFNNITISPKVRCIKNSFGQNIKKYFEDIYRRTEQEYKLFGFWGATKSCKNAEGCLEGSGENICEKSKSGIVKNLGQSIFTSIPGHYDYVMVCSAEIDEYGDIAFDFHNSKDTVYFVNYNNLVFENRSIFYKDRYLKKRKIVFITDENSYKVKTYMNNNNGDYLVNFDLQALHKDYFTGEKILESMYEDDQYTICLSRRIREWKNRSGNEVVLSIGNNDSSFFNPKIKIKKWVETAALNLKYLFEVFGFDGINIDVQHIGNDNKRAVVY